MDKQFKIGFAAILAAGFTYSGLCFLNTYKTESVHNSSPVPFRTHLVGLRSFQPVTIPTLFPMFTELQEKYLSKPDPDTIRGLFKYGNQKISKSILYDVIKAANYTHMNPALLMAIAEKESNFNSTVKAKTSSATGLFQFIDRTWLTALHKFGSRYGYEIGESPTGKAREKLLSLRKNAFLSAVFAAEMLKHDGTELAHKIGRPLTVGETYLIHFLGSDDAELFMKTMKTSPYTSAASLLPNPAHANKPIFFARKGNSVKDRSVAEVHDVFESMIGSRFKRYVSVTTALPQGVTAYTE